MVEVPAGDLARSRVLLAQEGLPVVGRPGLELFDEPSWGMTDFTQRVTYRRALEGELERTISNLQGVEGAEVHLALSESSPLRRLDRPAEAAVVVRLRGNGALAPDAVQGITYLVASSVEHLSAAHVAVLNAAGHVLSLPSEDGSEGLASHRQVELQRSVEKHLANKVQRLVATVVGADQARVQVSARLNFDRVERTSETYDPEGQVLQSEQRSQTAPGVALDEGETPLVTITNNYQNTRQVENIVSAVGSIEQLSVAVLVDQQSLNASGANPAAAIANLEALVRDAVGADPSRGDRVTVRGIPFEAAPVVSEVPVSDPAVRGAPDYLGMIERFAKPVIGLVGIAVVFLLARQLITTQRSLAGDRSRTPHSVPSVAPPEAMPEPEPLDPAMLIRQRVVAEASDRPENTASVVRAWLAEA